jgi:hypothetical protein
LASLCTCLQHIKTLYLWQEPAEDEHTLFRENHTAQELLNQAENINQYCFYGRCLGFQVIYNIIFLLFLTTNKIIITCTNQLLFKNNFSLFSLKTLM